MGKPVAPRGGIPTRNEKRANKLYWDGEDWHTASPPAPSDRRKKPHFWRWVLGIVLVLFLIGRCSDTGHQASKTSAASKKTLKFLDVSDGGPTGVCGVEVLDAAHRRPTIIGLNLNLGPWTWTFRIGT